MTSGGCSELYSPLRFTISCFMQKKNTWRAHWEGYTQSHFPSMKDQKLKRVRNKLTCYFPGALGVVYISTPKVRETPSPPRDFVGFCNS